MARENTTNFASTTLTSTIAGTNTTSSFTVQTGGGAAFPTVDALLNPRYIYVTVDTEVLICSQRSADTFTIVGRGAEGSTMALHNVGAPVTCGFTSGMLTRIWTNLPETYHPDVPPYIYNGTSPSTWNDEFESNSGLWTYYPSASNWDIATSHFSCVTFNRADYDNTTYYLYKPFQPGTGSWQVTAKLSHSCRYGLANNASIGSSLFVSDQANPTASPDAGNNVRIESFYNAADTIAFNSWVKGSVTSEVRVISASHASSGAWNLITSVVDQGALYFRIAYNGSGLYDFYIGDGYTYREIANVSKTLNLANGTIGFRFFAANASGVISHASTLIDWLRVDTSITTFSA